LGAYRIPLETGLLIPSGKRGNRRSEVPVRQMSGFAIYQALSAFPMVIFMSARRRRFAC
jgi:hypothetical protein